MEGRSRGRVRAEDARNNLSPPLLLALQCCLAAFVQACRVVYSGLAFDGLAEALGKVRSCMHVRSLTSSERQYTVTHHT